MLAGPTNAATGKRVRAPWRRVAALLLAVSATLAAQEIRLDTPALVKLAQAAPGMPADMRWDLADSLLVALITDYDTELERAREDRIADARRSAKLARWRAATGLLAETLVEARLALSAGAPFTIEVDATEQVMLFVDDRPIVFSTARPGTEQAAMARVVDDFCTRHDCATLLGEAMPMAPAAMRAAGAWLIRQNASPSYDIEGHLRCRFVDLGDRHVKAEACRAAAADVDTLRQALDALTGQGITIDWDALAAHRPREGSDAVVRVTADGRYLRLQLARLPRLDDAGWRDLVLALRRHLRDPGSTIGIRNGEDLLHR
jgi:hypothetical protein